MTGRDFELGVDATGTVHRRTNALIYDSDHVYLSFDSSDEIGFRHHDPNLRI